MLIACQPAYRCLSGFHREPQQRQQSYSSWMNMLTVSELDGILKIRCVGWVELSLCCGVCRLFSECYTLLAL